MRLALSELKVSTCYILRNYKLLRGAKTEVTRFFKRIHSNLSVLLEIAILVEWKNAHQSNMTWFPSRYAVRMITTGGYNFNIVFWPTIYACWFFQKDKLTIQTIHVIVSSLSAKIDQSKFVIDSDTKFTNTLWCLLVVNWLERNDIYFSLRVHKLSNCSRIMSIY